MLNKSQFIHLMILYINQVLPISLFLNFLICIFTEIYVIVNTNVMDPELVQVSGFNG